MDSNEQKRITVHDGSGRTWVFSGPAGPAEQWLRRQAVPTVPAVGQASSGTVVSTGTSRGSDAPIRDVTEILLALDQVLAIRQARADDSTPVDGERTRQLLAS